METAIANAAGQRLTHAERVLWPDAEGGPITKAELAAYYRCVAAWMLAHIARRPCSLKRAPDGVRGETFYQRHPAPGTPSAIARMAITGSHAPYLALNDEAAFAAAAQIAVVEIHPWNCQPLRPDAPGRLVIDLDPGPGVTFDTVIGAAREVRERFDDLGLESYCKTTGGKGLHVVAPLRAENNAAWALAKSVARALAVQMAADAPAAYLTVADKDRRDGRIYLDYLRNDRTATAIAPLSPRGHAGAPVAMPLNWAQVRVGLDPSRFTLRTAARALARTRPWTDYGDTAGSLAAAAQKLRV